MLHPSTKRLIDTLGERTRQKKVAWTEAEDGAVVHDTEGYRVQISGEPHTVLLLDALGKELDKVTLDDYSEVTDDDGRPYSKFVAELFREAHRHARGTERAIEKLLAGLSDEDDELIQTDTQDETEVGAERLAEEDSFEADTPDDVSPDVVLTSEEDIETTRTSEVFDDNRAPMMGVGAAAVDQLSDRSTYPEEQDISEETGSFTSDTAPELQTADEQDEDNDLVGLNDAFAATQGQYEATEPAGTTLDDATTEDDDSNAIVETNPFLQSPQTADVGDDNLPGVTAYTPEAETVSELEQTSEATDYRSTAEDIISAPGFDADGHDGEDLLTTDNQDVTTEDLPKFNTEPSSTSLAGFAPVDIEEPSDAYVPEEETDALPNEPSIPQQGFSLSGIGAGFGLGSAKPNITDTFEETSGESEQIDPAAEVEQVEAVAQPATDFIDGTQDLPEDIGELEEVETPADAPLTDATDALQHAHAAVTETAEELADAAEEALDEAGEDSKKAASGIFGGLLGRGKSTAEEADETAEQTSEEDRKVIDDLADDPQQQPDEKPKTTPRFNPWN